MNKKIRWYDLKIWRESINKKSTMIDMKKKTEKEHSEKPAEWKRKIKYREIKKKRSRIYSKKYMRTIKGKKFP